MKSECGSRSWPNHLEQGYQAHSKKQFKAKFRSDYVVTAESIGKQPGQQVQFIDNRSQAEYLGIYTGGPQERAGSLPNATHLNYDWLTINGSGIFQSIDNLKQIYAASKIPLRGDQINYCHTGHRASLAWFVSHELLGNTAARLYDGSTAEWAINPDLPMDQHIKLSQP